MNGNTLLPRSNTQDYNSEYPNSHPHNTQQLNYRHENAWLHNIHHNSADHDNFSTAAFTARSPGSFNVNVCFEKKKNLRENEGQRRECGLILKYKNTHSDCYLFQLMIAKIGFVRCVATVQKIDNLYVHKKKMACKNSGKGSD